MGQYRFICGKCGGVHTTTHELGDGRTRSAAMTAFRRELKRRQRDAE